MSSGKKSLWYGWLILTILLASQAAWAGGAKEAKPPVIEMAEQARIYIAPGNSAAQIHNLELPFSSITIPGKDRVIRSWTFSVFNASGVLVYTDAKFETKDRGFFGELFDIGPKLSVDIPKDLSWDGTYKVPNAAYNGQLVPDGNYTYQIGIIDDNGSRAQTPPFNVTVRNAPIAVDYVRIPIPIFNPLGKRNTVQIEQSGTRETLWEGRISDEQGAVVRSFSWGNPSLVQSQDIRPNNFAWDGKDDGGKVLPEGKYWYTLTGSNRPGASAELKCDVPIVLSMKSGSLILGASAKVISPNGDGLFDTVTIKTQVDDPAGLQQWLLSIADVRRPDAAIWSRSGKGAVPAQLVFDGLGDNGMVIGDGNYQAVLSASYDNGNTAESLPVLFESDLAPPAISISSELPVFGGTTKPETIIKINGSASVTWLFSVTDKLGKTVLEQQITDPENYSFAWKGTDGHLTLLPDDLYTLSVSGRDWAGNKGMASVRVRKDSRNMTAAIELSQPIMNPNKGAQSLVRITPVLQVLDSIESMQLGIVSQNDVTVAQKDSTLIIPFWDWYGKTDNGKPLADGNYTVYALVNYSNGSSAKASIPLVVDSKIPDIILAVKPSVSAFSPAKGTMQFQLSASPATGIKDWKLILKHDASMSGQTFSGAGAVPASVVWDGKTDSRATVDGAYTARLLVNYDNGMKGEAIAATKVLVSSTGPQFDLGLSSDTFVPGNLDGPASLDIMFQNVKSSLQVASWKVAIMDGNGKAFRTFSGLGAAPASVNWDGLSDVGAAVDSGEDYHITASLVDSLGQETQKSTKVTIDILVMRMPDGSLKIVVSSIQFPGYSSDLFKVQDNLLDKNMFALRRLATVLNKFTAYKIRLEGYAVSEFWNDPKQAEWEQKTELLPLSADRATAVMKVLVLLGVDHDRFAVNGFGSDKPLVPNSDLENRWKNRRVEFYLENK